MLSTILALALTQMALADKLEVTAKDGVTEFELDCGQGATIYPVPLLLDPAPPACKLIAWKPMAEFPAKGKITCNTSSCDVMGEHDMLEVTAPYPINVIMLDCDGEQKIWDFVDTKVTIDIDKSCKASLGATFEGVPPGTWSCGLAECGRPAGAHNVTLQLAKGTATAVSLTCNDDKMRKKPLEGGKASFTDVPNEECTATFEGGGPPAKARPIKWGESSCEVNGATAVCRKK